MKTVIFFVVVVAAAIGGWYFFDGRLTPAPPVNTSSTADSTVPSDWKEYRNSEGKFSVRIPQNLEIREGSAVVNTGWSYNNAEPGKTFAEIIIPSSFEPNSNFSEAKFHVGASNDTDVIADCLQPDYEGQQITTRSINGTAFTIFAGSDAGAGNFYEVESYRIVRDGQCYAVELLIHSTNVANYPPEQNIHEFDRARVGGLLHQMVDSFKFF